MSKARKTIHLIMTAVLTVIVYMVIVAILIVISKALIGFIL